jgi:hypothetical protein
MARDWIILGASSSIAKAFMKKVAHKVHHLILVGRDKVDLEHSAQDLKIRYHIRVDVIQADLSLEKDINDICFLIENSNAKLSLFIAHSAGFQNKDLNQAHIQSLINTNIQSTIQLIHHFIYHAKKPQSLIYLSSVAGDRGRSANSLYGASKKAIEVYLEGLKTSIKHIDIFAIRLGFIDTPQTYGKKGVFLAKSPEKCATFLDKIQVKRLNRQYYPWFWRYIMLIIKAIPKKIFNRLSI